MILQGVGKTRGGSPDGDPERRGSFGNQSHRRWTPSTVVLKGSGGYGRGESHPSPGAPLFPLSTLRPLRVLWGSGNLYRVGSGRKGRGDGQGSGPVRRGLSSRISSTTLSRCSTSSSSSCHSRRGGPSHRGSTPASCSQGQWVRPPEVKTRPRV